jgi:DNA-binding transcriptional MerR regulator
MLLKVGELAKRTGLTVRTLHHYDAIGLLSPSGRSGAGYRLYNREDIARLHRIQALRRLDLSLTEIGRLLEGDAVRLQTVIEQQIVSLDRQLMRTAVLRDRLKSLLTSVQENAEPDLPTWLATLELMAVYDKYFTVDDLNTLRLLRENLGPDKLRKGVQLIPAIRALMRRGVPPDSPEAQALSVPWRAVVQQSMGGDPRLILKLVAMHRREPVAQAQTGVDGDMIDYMSAATAAYRLAIYAKYLSEDELNTVRRRHGRNREQWLLLFAEMRERMEQGAQPDCAEVQALCARWIALAREEWGDDPIVGEKIQAVHEAEPEMLNGIGISPEMAAFFRKGIAHMDARHSLPDGAS